MSRSKITEELVEECAAQGLTREEAAARFEMTPISFRNALYDNKRAWIKQAWNRGRAKANGAAVESPVETAQANDELTHVFYILLRDCLPVGRLHKVVKEVIEREASGKEMSNAPLAELARYYSAKLQSK